MTKIPGFETLGNVISPLYPKLLVTIFQNLVNLVTIFRNLVKYGRKPNELYKLANLYMTKLINESSLFQHSFLIYYFNGNIFFYYTCI